MTYSPDVAVVVAGVLALLGSALTLYGLRAARANPPPQWAFSKQSYRRFNVPTLFVPIFFGVLSLGFSTEIVSTPLGTALCIGMAAYFAMKGWSYARSPEIRESGPYLGTYLAFAAAGCYLAGAVVSNVI
jgi:hypothetical protein